ncbi:MAG: DUF3179 domain-containing protein [Thermoleophilia bacterium]|nr:DUF3179 domain-containing protein [Thermoleophilia bacterium]
MSTAPAPGGRGRWAVVIALLVTALAIGLAGCGSQDDGGASGAAAATAPAHLQGPWRTDFGRASVPLAEITSGGPPKDGIPAIDAPRFVGAGEAGFLTDREPVLVVELGGRARAYPIRILIWHEIVNDELAGTPLAVTYCPLCNTALVFDRRAAGRTLDFGTTGNLRNSDLVMYDRQTETWWQQFGGEAIVGALTGTRLDRVPSRILSAAEFRARHPGGQVLSQDTGHDRPYGQSPYRGYDAPGSPTIFGTANADDRRLDPKERVVFIEAGDESVAVPFSVLRERRSVGVTLAGRRLTVRWRPGVSSALDAGQIGGGRDVGAALVTDAAGRPVAFEEPFWFAVGAFRPDVRIVRG